MSKAKKVHSNLAGFERGKARKSIAMVAVLAALGCTSQFSYANIGPGGSLIKLPGDTEIDHSLQHLTQAWNAIQQNNQIQDLMTDSRNTLSIATQISSNKLQTVKFQQYFNGLEVVGSMAMHQTSPYGSQVINRLAQFDISTQPRLSANAAVGIAKSLVGDRQLSNQPELKILPEAEGNGARLVYWVNLDANNQNMIDGGREIIIDANTGEVIGNISKDIPLAPVDVYSAKDQGTSISENVGTDPDTGKQTLTGCTLKNLANGSSETISADKCQNLSLSDLPARQCQVILDDSPLAVIPQNCSAEVRNSSPVANVDPSALRAAQNSEAVLNYYKKFHNRDSYDNRGSKVISVVHAGLGFDNAFWNTQQNIMVYGDGDGKTFGDFTAALDVAGHEMTHGVVNATAKLLGMGESGALNEAFADFFGKMIANDGDWAIGRKLFLNQAHADGVRNLADPGKLKYCAQVSDDGSRCLERKPFPSNISEKQTSVGTCDSTNDNCWVHINSTIPSHASYLVYQAIGKQKAETLYYVALTQSLTARDNITTAARSIKKTCTQILDPASCEKVNQAYAQVGL